MARRTVPLDPYGRSTLRNVLSPPQGYRLKHALGTAYSIDAETLVTIPLFAAGIGAEDLEKSVGISRIYELGTRLTLLVQGDRIAISKRWASSRPLLRLVGDAVVPCSIKGGSFHPKLLVLEFEPIQGQNENLVRVVIATRNLTTDNSWDSVVVLDQVETGGVCVPGLSDAVRDLAKFVNDPTHPAVEQCRQIGRALERARFQPLRGVTDLEVRLFHPDSKNADNIFEMIKGDDLLIISPFVHKSVLDKLAAQSATGRSRRWLVTRPVDVPDSAFTDYQVFQISNGAMKTYDVSDQRDASELMDGRGRLVGLHAKIYLASSKKGGTRLVVTSANATRSGWTGNVEVAVTGVAKARTLQVPDLLAEERPDQERTFRSLLEEITPSSVELGQRDPPWIKTVRSILAGAAVVGWVQNGPPRTLAVTVKIMGGRLDWPDGVEIGMCPFGYDDSCAHLTLEKNSMSGIVEIDAGIELTPFVALTLRYGDEVPLDIVLAMQLHGDLDWDRDAARMTLAQAARPELYRELLWYFGVKGHNGSSPGSPVTKTSTKKPGSDLNLPILERVLLRVHGTNAQAEIATIDSLLAGLTNDAEDGRLTTMWRLVKESLR
ncbi:hypothetical protein [Pandoraea commovens]|uniref:PLD phosphodiesterase domain-containing protein n=1 Tax=Pandoraea commovens TaxID=2508289 RepID=A0ABY5QI41_9BURK|nr:hypothetical protein [Pandoraea commovens]UVA79570.1 hypothetical protein NTU39_00540 [Pandoraea commovens]